jgi:hypothetical protein
MTKNTTVNCVNGKLAVGDLVLSTPEDDYALLVGEVLAINKVGSPEHTDETDNDTDAIHVDFFGPEYTKSRIIEIEEMFSRLYVGAKRFVECPLDDVIMAPDMLINITGISTVKLKAILNSEAEAGAFYKRVVSEYEQAHPKPVITEKLFSPLKCDLFEANDDGEWEEAGQVDGIFYSDQIASALEEYDLPESNGRGLMEYYSDDAEIDRKVHSLVVGAEEHDGKLWGVATLELVEPLSFGEMEKLKDYLSGQYSDGFGEGFEQHEIDVDDGEIYVHLWSPDDAYFIDTEVEFARRLAPYKVEYAEDKISDLAVYLHLADGDIAGFLADPEIERLSAALRFRPMSLDDMKDYLGDAFLQRHRLGQRAEKPSVLAQIRQAQTQAKNAPYPHKKTHRDNSGPDL